MCIAYKCGCMNDCILAQSNIFIHSHDPHSTFYMSTDYTILKIYRDVIGLPYFDFHISLLIIDNKRSNSVVHIQLSYILHVYRLHNLENIQRCNRFAQF